ncbi:MAG: ferredoxin [Verrucomicrobiales bacterium]
MPDFINRYPDNAPGTYYVTDDCGLCDVCLEICPTVFLKNEKGGYAFVFKQPESEEEIEVCEQAVDACPREAIGDDGDDYDWESIPSAL